MPSPTRLHPRFDIRTVSDLAGLEQLRPAWNNLLSSAVRPTVFAAWEWQYLCAKHMAEGKDIVVLAVFDGERLAAVLPLHRERSRLAGVIPTETMACLGGDITDYNVLLVREQHLSTAIPALAEHLRLMEVTLDFRNVLPGTPLYLLVDHLAGHGFPCVPYETKTALYSQIGHDYEAFIKGLKKKFRKNLNNNQNYMDRTGGYNYHVEDADKDTLDTLIRLHTNRWQYKGEAGALAQQKIKAFHSDLQDLPGRLFEIRYFTICHDDQIVSIVYGFIFQNCYYAYLSGLDMAHDRISPGNMVLSHTIRELIKAGISGFDMLRGDMHYKQSWATGSMERRDVILFPPTIRGRITAAAMKTIMGAKRLIPKAVKRRVKAAVGSSADATGPATTGEDDE
jgi:CelD/BcsL family acetyltransferase involved in cellulose biosynthesis